MAYLEDRVALVTGATRGIGLRIAEALAEEGARVFICGRSRDGLESALEGLRARGPDRVDGAVADVRSHPECRALVAAAVTRFGGLDILVNNAGIGIFKTVEELSPEEWDATVATNLSAVFYLCHEAIPHLKARGDGYIFNISSLAATSAFATGAAYNASKFGLGGFTDALLQEVRHAGIRVSAILPGSVATDFRGPTARPEATSAWKLLGEDVARAVLDLYRYPGRAIASRIEIRPARPPR